MNLRILILSSLLVLLIFFKFFLSSPINQKKIYQEELDNLNMEEAKIVAQIRRYKKDEFKLKGLEAKVREKEEKIITNKSWPSLMDDIFKIREKFNFASFDMISRQIKENKDERFSKLQIEIQIKARYHQILNFIDNLSYQKSGLSFSISSLEINRQKQSNLVMSKLHLLVYCP